VGLTVTPDQYGAIGNGNEANSTVDTAGINAAIAAVDAAGEGEVRLPSPRQYVLENTDPIWCTQSKSHVTIIGDHREQSICRLKGGLGGTNWYRMFDVDGSAGVRFANFTIDGNRANLGTLDNNEQHHGIVLRNNGTTDAIIEDMVIINCQGDGILFTGNPLRPTVRRSRFMNNYRGGVQYGHGSFSHIHDNYIEGTTGTPSASEWGISGELDTSDGPTHPYTKHVIEDNVINACNSGIKLTGSPHASLYALPNYPNVTIRGNTIIARSDGGLSSPTGITVSNALDPTAILNSISGYEVGIYLIGSTTAAKILGNTIANGPTATHQENAAIILGLSTVPGANLRAQIRRNTIESMARGIVIGAQSNALLPEDLIITRNQVTALEAQALAFAAGDGAKILDNHFQTTTGARAAQLYRTSGASSTIDRIDYLANTHVGGSSENLLIDTAATNIDLGSDNDYSGSAQTVVYSA
jgi:hypothetical protein